MPAELQRLLEKEKQIKARIQQLKSQEKSRERKKDTRRKILIGGAILASIKNGKLTEQWLMELLDKALAKKQDRDLFNLDDE